MFSSRLSPSWTQPLNRIKPLVIFGLVLLLVGGLLGFGGRIGLELKDVHTAACPDTPEFQNLTGLGVSTTLVDCYMVEGTVVNNSKHELFNADVFGRIYDANGNDVLPDRTRLGSIETVPPGESPFGIRISVSPSNVPPLSLEQFKAAGFGGAIRR